MYRVTSIMKQLDTDNIKVTYDKLVISGFPKMRKIEIIALKIRLIDHTIVHAVHILKLLCFVEFRFQKNEIIIGMGFLLTNNWLKTKSKSIKFMLVTLII